MLALVLAAAVAANPAVPAARSFWKPVEGQALQPSQVEVPATLVGEGNHIAVYQEKSYRFSDLGAVDEQRQIAELVTAFDTIIYPREVGLFGPCPDLDGNGKVIVLLTSLTRHPGIFWRFDQMPEAQAVRYGFHSNHGEVLYQRFRLQGNRSEGNIVDVARTFHRLLHYARDPGETDWSSLVANYAPYLCDLTNARLLWGDSDPDGHPHFASDPLQEDGWSLLLLEYVREQLGDGALRRLVEQPGPGLAGLSAVATATGGRTAVDMMADMAMATWLDDPLLEKGRFSFTAVAPPRPQAGARVAASRPGAGYVTVGVGGMAFVVVDGTGERPLPFTLQGEPKVSWIGRAVHVKRSGPDTELPLTFDSSGLARLELPALANGDAVIVAAVPEPAPTAMFDRRQLMLQWGLGWVPRRGESSGESPFRVMLADALPDHGSAARNRLLRTLSRLTGQTAAAEEPVVTTRYAWAPESANVLEVLRQEAARRQLTARPLHFVQKGPEGIQQTWTDLLVDLPGTDPRRWPIVIAAHWDGARTDVADSYLRALNVDDDATGTAVAMEVAAALKSVQHRVPVLVAFLAGGYQGASGARALLESLNGHVAVWIDLEGVGVPAPPPHERTVMIEGGERVSRIRTIIGGVMDGVGLMPVTPGPSTSPHTGADLASSLGIASVVIRTRNSAATAGAMDTPVAVEATEVSPDLMVLLTKAITDAVAQLAGTT